MKRKKKTVYDLIEYFKNRHEINPGKDGTLFELKFMGRLDPKTEDDFIKNNGCKPGEVWWSSECNMFLVFDVKGNIHKMTEEMYIKLDGADLNYL